MQTESYILLWPWDPQVLCSDLKFVLFLIPMLSWVGTVEIIQFKPPILWKWEPRPKKGPYPGPLSCQGQAGRTRTGPSGSPSSALCSHQTRPFFTQKLALILERADGQVVSWLSQSPLKDYELLEGRTVFCSLFYSHRVAWCLPHVRQYLFVEQMNEMDGVQDI